jgi:hypothetical protein
MNSIQENFLNLTAYSFLIILFDAKWRNTERTKTWLNKANYQIDM